MWQGAGGGGLFSEHGEDRRPPTSVALLHPRSQEGRWPGLGSPLRCGAV